MYDLDALMTKQFFNRIGLVADYFVLILVIAKFGVGYAIIPLLISFVLFWNLYAIKQQINDYHAMVKHQELETERKIKNQYTDQCIQLGYAESNCYTDLDRTLWVHSDIIYIAETEYAYKKRYLKSQDHGTDLYKKLQYTTIPVKDIQYFSKEGDIQYTSRVSGGGGGGSSLSGAIIGGIIAGETGAIIGSRKKTNEIVTRTVTHDQRQSVVRYFEDNSLKTLTCSGFKLYDYLSLKIPEKDLLTIQLQSIPTSTVVQEPTQPEPTPPVKESEPIKAKLQQLQDLHNSGLITDAEYAEKKRSLLDSL